MAGEVDLTRVINTIAVTLNDHKLDHFDAELVQEMATGATGGEQSLIAYGSGTSGELRDGSIDGPAVAKIQLDRGEWSIERGDSVVAAVHLHGRIGTEGGELSIPLTQVWTISDGKVIRVREFRTTAEALDAN